MVMHSDVTCSHHVLIYCDKQNILKMLRMEIRKQVNRFFFYIGVSQPAIAEACTERSNVTLDFKTVYFDEKKSIQKSASRVSA